MTLTVTTTTFEISQTEVEKSSPEIPTVFEPENITLTTLIESTSSFDRLSVSPPQSEPLPSAAIIDQSVLSQQESPVESTPTNEEDTQLTLRDLQSALILDETLTTPIQSEEQSTIIESPERTIHSKLSGTSGDVIQSTVDSSLHTLVDTNVIETESLNHTSDLDSKEEPQNIEETATANTEESQKEPKVLTKEEEDALLLAEYEQELQEQAKRQNALKSPPRESALETIVEGPEDPDEAIAQQKLQEMKKYEEEKARERLLATALRAEVLYDFTTTEENKLNLKVGDVIIVLEAGEKDSWWLGELNGKTGYFPENYCHIIKPKRRLTLSTKVSDTIKNLQAQCGFLSLNNPLNNKLV